MFSADRRYKIHWELTDLCHLKCPMCPRTNIFDHCRPVKEVQNTQFFLDDVEEYFPVNFLKRLARIDFCGTFGDPCVARDFYEICELLVKKYGITIMVSTNGSMRNPAWWKKLGKLFAGTQSWLEFHVDGLRDTNHLYRIGANWEKIMANANAFISGGARAEWHYILFKHNQHQVVEAYLVAREMGFNKFVPTETGRFPPDGTFRYMHPDGDWRNLERATISLRDGIKETEATIFPHIPDFFSAKKTNKHSAAAFVVADNHSFQNNYTNFSTTVNGITCKSAKQNRFFLDSRGYVEPCCWVSSRDIQRPGDMRKSLSLAGKDLDSYNIRNRPIERILHDERFTKVYADLWKADALATCRKKCDKHHRNYKFEIKF